MKTTLGRWLLSAVVIGVMAVYPLSAMSAWGFALMVLTTSYLIYWHLADMMMMRRRALLGFVVEAESYWRRRLWNSAWIQLLTAIAAIAIALLALAAAHNLSVPEWGVIAASVFTFSLIETALRGTIERHIQDEHRSSMLLRLTHLLNMIVVVGALLAVHFWLTDVPDTRHLGAAEVMIAAYQFESAQATMSLIGWLTGISAALHSFFWHLIQLLSSQAPWWLTLAIWLVVMTGLAIQVGFIWLVLLGGYAWLQRLIPRSGNLPTEKQAKPSRWLQEHLSWGFAAVFCLLIWLVSEYAQQHVHLSERRVTQADGVSSHQDPCAAPISQDAEQLWLEQSSDVRREHEQAAVTELEAHIEQIVAQAYQPAEAMVDAFLDWNFSLTGQYTQLAYLMRGSFTEAGFEGLMSERIDRFAAEYLGPRMQNADSELNQTLESVMRVSAQAYGQALRSYSEQQFCLQLPALQLDIPQLVHKSAVGAGAAPGLMLASRALLPGRAIATRSGVRRMFSALFARLSTRAATSSAAAGAGTICGPGCMLILGGATWIGTDLLINYGDEKLNRSDMREELLAALAQQKEEFSAQLKYEAATVVGQVFNDLEREQNQRFNLYRELNLR